MKLRRTLAVLVCLAMAMCLVGASAESFADKDMSKHYSITYASVQIDDTKNYYDSDEWCKWWGDTFNLDYEITSLSWANWQENLRIWISSGDMPDWCVWNYVHGDMVNYVDQELVKKLPDDWKEKYPNLAKSQEDVQLAALDEELFGGTYVLFRPDYSLNFPAEKVTDHISCYIRKDWAKAVGVEIESGDLLTLDQLYDLAAKMKEADPGNVGEGFTPIVCRSAWLGWLLQFNDCHSGIATNEPVWYVGEDGQYHWGPADEAIGEALVKLKAAYDAGLVDPEFYTLQEPDDVGEFYSLGTSGITITEGMAYKMDEFAVSMKQDLGVDFDDAVAVVAIAGTDGKVHAQALPNFWGANIFSPSIDDGELDRILTMMDYSCTPEGQERIHFGIEGVDYEKDADGNCTSLLSEDEDIWEKYAMLPVYVNMVVLSDDFQFDNPQYTERSRAICKKLHEVRAENSTEETFPSAVNWDAYLHSSQALNFATMKYEDEYARLITMDGDILENWQNWVNEKMPVIQPVLDELNAKLAE